MAKSLSCRGIAQFGKIRRVIETEAFYVTRRSIDLCPKDALTCALIGILLCLDLSVFPPLPALGKGKIVEKRLTGSINRGKSFRKRSSLLDGRDTASTGQQRDNQPGTASPARDSCRTSVIEK